MSSTNRGAKRAPLDTYITPLWTVHRLLEVLSLPGGLWMDPCAGSGNIVQAARMLRPEVRWKSYEIRPECLDALVNADADPTITDFTKVADPPKADVVLMNPPFGLAQQFIEKCLNSASHVVVLLRLNYLGSQKRNAFMREHCPDVYILPNRPGFTPDGKTDSIEYAWMHFRQGAPGLHGRIMVLPVTPRAERCF